MLEMSSPKKTEEVIMILKQELGASDENEAET